MNKHLIEFYEEYLAKGSNISEQAKRHGITNTECYTLVTMGKRLTSN